MNEGNELEFEIPKKAYIFYFAFLIAPLIYLFIAYELSGSLSLQADKEFDNVFMIFPFVAFATGVAGILCKKYFCPKIAIIVSEETFDRDFQKYMAGPMIVYLAFFESICIYGFVTFFMGNKFEYFVLYAAVSMALMLIFFPKREFFIELYKQQKVLVSKGKFRKGFNSL